MVQGFFVHGVLKKLQQENVYRKPGFNAPQQETIYNNDRTFIITMVDYRDYITIEPGKRSGKPCIRGLRITVFDVLSYLAAGMSTEEVLNDFPELTKEDVLACLAYAADAERQVRIAV